MWNNRLAAIWRTGVTRWVSTALVRACLVTVILAGAGHAALAGALSERFSPNDPASVVKIDNSLWNKLLKAYLREDSQGLTRLDYGSLKKQGHADLDSYLDYLQSVDPAKLSRDEQFAYWTNLYNAKTADIIVENYPVKSIRDIRLTNFLIPGPWRKKVMRVSGVELSLDDIEHAILRPIWGDPRIHYAVNCAAVGCPNLLTRAYTADALEGMLEEASRDYINSPRGARFDKDGQLIASSLYKWYTEDFGGSVPSVLEHIRKYAGPVLAKKITGVTQIEDYEYDWALNDKK